MKSSLHQTATVAPLCVAIALSSLAVAPSSSGASFYWDSNGTTPGAGETPSGIWGIDNFWNADETGNDTPGGYTSGSDAIFSAGSDAVNPYTVTLSGNQIANSVTFRSSGQATLTGGELRLGAGGLNASSNTVLSSITRMTANQTWTIASNTSVTQSGNLLGAYALTKDGGGTLIVSGSGTVFGSLRISEGVVNVTGAGTIGLQTDIILDNTAGVLLDFTGSTGSKGFRTLNGGGANGGNINATTTISFYGAAGAVGDYSGVISGNGGFSILSGGTQTLRGANTYRGITSVVRGGTLEFTSIANVNGGASSLGAVTTASAGTLTMGLAADTVASTLRYIGTGHSSNREIALASATGGAILEANGTGALTISGKVSATGAGSKTLTLKGTNTDDNTLSGGISDNSAVNRTSVTKQGSGRWVLGGVNTYTGATLVEEGTLIINGSLASGSSVTVQAGATLGGHGQIGGSATVRGTLAGGGDFTTLTVGGLSFSETSSLNLSYGLSGGTIANDRVSVIGGISIEAGANLSFSNSEVHDLFGIFFLLLNDGNDAIAGTFTTFNNTAISLNEGAIFEWNAQQWEITYQADFASSSFTGGNDLALRAIPEPSAWLLLATAGGATLVYRRRRSVSVW